MYMRCFVSTVRRSGVVTRKKALLEGNFRIKYRNTTRNIAARHFSDQKEDTTDVVGMGGDNEVARSEALSLEEVVEGAKHGGPKFLIQFTCDADVSLCSQNDDSSRKTVKVISKKAYEEGICLVKCPCEKLHLIADNLGWFGDEKSNVETIMAEKGESVRRLAADEMISVS